MRMFCIKKIHGFLFPVSCMSDLRVWQNEYLLHTDGWWRMERCHALAVLVDIIVSFDSAKQILGDFNRLMKNCPSCINWEPRVVRFGLWCCRSSNEYFMVLGWVRVVRGMMSNWHAWPNFLKVGLQGS
jgi:hypothetical protein